MVLAKPLRKFSTALRYWLPTRLTLKCNPRVHVSVMNSDSSGIEPVCLKCRNYKKDCICDVQTTDE